MVDREGFRAWKGGAPLDLEPKALSLLVFLVQNSGKLIEKKALLDAVWGDAFVTENVLSRAIAQLRKALDDDAKDSRYIETVPTRGYRFTDQVIVESDPAAPARSAPIGGSTMPPSAKRGRALQWTTAAVLSLGVLAGGYFLYRRLAGPKFLRVVKNQPVTNSVGLSFYPTLAPDGTRVAYSADRGHGFQICVRELAAGSPM
jgi:DNA-binding winged helix-turn-helix (wHTH) protein